MSWLHCLHLKSGRSTNNIFLNTSQPHPSVWLSGRQWCKSESQCYITQALLSLLAEMISYNAAWASVKIWFADKLLLMLYNRQQNCICLIMLGNVSEVLRDGIKLTFYYKICCKKVDLLWGGRGHPLYWYMVTILSLLQTGSCSMIYHHGVLKYFTHPIR